MLAGAVRGSVVWRDESAGCSRCARGEAATTMRLRARGVAAELEASPSSSSSSPARCCCISSTIYNAARPSRAPRCLGGGTRVRRRGGRRHHQVHEPGGAVRGVGRVGAVAGQLLGRRAARVRHVERRRAGVRHLPRGPDHLRDPGRERLRAAAVPVPVQRHRVPGRPRGRVRRQPAHPRHVDGALDHRVLVLDRPRPLVGTPAAQCRAPSTELLVSHTHARIRG